MLNYVFDWSILTTSPYFQWLISGAIVTLQLSFAGIILASLLGTLLAVMRMSSYKILRGIARVYIEFIRNTPLLIQIFFWYFGSYQIIPTALNDWLNQWDFEFTASLIALTIYTSAFIAEDIRSGILSIPKEQMEASLSAGFSHFRAMQYVILPQAIRIVILPIVNQFLNLTKNSSLAMTIGVMELTYQARQIESYTFKGFEPFTVATLFYVFLSFLITFLMHQYNKRVLNLYKVA